MPSKKSRKLVMKAQADKNRRDRLAQQRRFRAEERRKREYEQQARDPDADA